MQCVTEHNQKTGPEIFRSNLNGEVTLANWRDPPFNRWAFQHVSEIVPCAMIWRSSSPGALWSRDIRNVQDIQFHWDHGQTTVGDMLDQTTTDGFLVLHRGKLVHETYDAGLKPSIPHILFSISKSLTSLVVGILQGSGVLNIDRPLVQMLPETRGSAFEDATVRNLLDMTVALDFQEDYVSPTGDMVEYREATGWSAGGDSSLGLRRYLCTLKKSGQHGVRFHYCSPSTDMLGWVVERVSGSRYSELLSEVLFQPAGTFENAYVGVDPYGAARASGGICMTLRDLARIGELVLGRGALDGAQIVPESWIDDIYSGGSRETWIGGSFEDGWPDAWYRSQWYKQGTPVRAISGFGIYGQALYINPRTETVIAKLSSQPQPLDWELEAFQRAAFDAIAQGL